MNQSLCINIIDQLVYQLHPTVLIEIMDHFRRRRRESHVFGLLIGKKSKVNIEITEAINMIVNINEKGEINLDENHLIKMVELHHKSSPNNHILGIYSTILNPNYCLTKLFLEISNKIRLDEQTLFLLLNCGKGENKHKIKGFIQKTKQDIICFISIPLELKITEDEKLAIETMNKSPQDWENFSTFEKNIKLKSGKDMLLDEIRIKQKSISELINFVDNTSHRHEKEGWELASLMYEIPCIPSHEFENMLNGSVQDLLMFHFLAKLTKIFINLSNKIHLQNIWLK